MENNSYFTYFSEIEDRFCQRRGTILILSTLDWALIETWKEAGIPLEAVLRGIDDAFDKYDARPRKTQKVNSLAYCSQAVLAAAEDMKAAAEGATRPEPTETGLEAPSVATYLTANADKLASLTAAPHTNCDASKVTLPTAAAEIVRDCSRTLRELAASFSTAVPSATNAAPDVTTTTSATGATDATTATHATSTDATTATHATSTDATTATNAASATTASPEGAEFDSPALQCRVPAPTASESRRDGTARRPSLEELERRLTVMEEKLFAALLAATPDEQIVAVRGEADRELSPYRRKMTGPQIEQLHKQYVHKRLLERYNIPRLSLFYMQ